MGRYWNDLHNKNASPMKILQGMAY